MYMWKEKSNQMPLENTNYDFDKRRSMYERKSLNETRAIV